MQPNSLFNFQNVKILKLEAHEQNFFHKFPHKFIQLICDIIWLAIT